MKSRATPMLLCLALLAACPTGSKAVSAGSTELPAARGRLALDGGQLRLDGLVLAESDAAAAVVPYQIVSHAPLLVTALLDGLEPATIVFTDDPQQPGRLQSVLHRSHVPQALPQGGAALISLPDPLTGVSSGLVLLDAAGGELWQASDGSQAQLMLPASPASLPPGSPPAPLLMLRWQGGDEIYPYGTEPELLHVHYPSDDNDIVIDSLRLELASPLAGAELLAANASHALLLLQFNFQAYEFALIKLDSMELVANWQLTGQPLTQLVYPGPGYAYLGLTADTAALSLVVYEGSAEGVIETWQFSFDPPGLSQSAYLGEIDLAADAANALDIGDVATVPYPQNILPSVGGESWVIPALRDGRGHVLAVYGDGSLVWLETDAAL